MITYSLYSNHPKIVHVEAGSPLFSAGDASGVMFVLVVGHADIVVGGHVVEQIGPGNFVGEMSLLDSAPRSATVVAATDCKFVELDEARFRDLVGRSPQFALEVMQVLAARLRRVDESAGPSPVMRRPYSQSAVPGLAQ